MSITEVTQPLLKRTWSHLRVVVLTCGLEVLAIARVAVAIAAVRGATPAEAENQLV